MSHDASFDSADRRDDGANLDAETVDLTSPEASRWSRRLRPWHVLATVFVAAGLALAVAGFTDWGLRLQADWAVDVAAVSDTETCPGVPDIPPPCRELAVDVGDRVLVAAWQGPGWAAWTIGSEPLPVTLSTPPLRLVSAVNPPAVLPTRAAALFEATDPGVAVLSALEGDCVAGAGDDLDCSTQRAVTVLVVVSQGQ